ncbi:MAG: hypothetical protein K8953_13915, partial [Proteobacteria bacterium]|nr:hypothetical protein [Pseudomonadota bacterium]
DYCMGDDADAGVCGPALARVCSASGDGANPFSDLCTGANNTYASVRMAFATNCFNGENNASLCGVTAFELPRTGDDTLCGDGTPGNLGNTPNDPTCMTTPVTVATCASEPFSTNCRSVATFAGARSAFVTNCFNDEFNAGTNGADCTVDAFSITRVGNEALCGNGDDIPGDNPLDPTCATSRSVQDCVRAPFDKDCKDNDIFAGARAGLITYCTRVDSQFTIGCGQAGLSCIRNPFDTSQGVDCEEQFGSEQAVTDAQNNLITHCTGADASNQRCVTNVMGTDVATCLANPFDAACDTALGSATQAETAQNNIISLCTGADADGTNALCMTASAGMAVADCLANPFGNACETTLGATQAETAQNNLIEVCTGVDVDGSNTRCMIATDAEVTACFTNPFGTGCDTELGDSLATAQNNLIEICSGDGADGTNARCTIGGIASALTGCLRDPFINHCDTTLGATQAMTAQRNILTLCTAEGSDALTTNTLCTDIARGGTDNAGNSRVAACLDNPFLETHTGVTCETVLGGADARARAQANLSRFCFDGTPGTMIYTELCTDALKTSQFCSGTAAGSNPFHAYCEDVVGIDEALVGERALFCAETANASDLRCAAYTTCNTNPFGS